MANNKKIKKESKHKKFYYSYNRRLTVNVVLFVVTLLFGLFFLKEAFTYEDAKVVNYSEHSNLDYKVYLKENSFYDEDYLPKDMLYVANLIDNIKVDFDYKFLIEEQIDLKFDYKILGKLVISDQNEENVYYEKTYDLLGNKSVTLSENTSKNITETIVIDYSKYNKIANTFKSSYGLTTKSKLIVYFTVNKEVLNDNFSIGNSINNMVLNIPLSEKSVDISLDYHDINNESKVLDNSRFVLDNIVYIFVSIILIILSLVFMVKSMRLSKYLIRKKNIYDKYVEKLLSEYDRLIVETTSPPVISIEDKNKIINIEKFTELLDVRDNLKQPIMYYVVTKHEKCHFYINSGEKIYLTTIKKVDLEVQNEKK